MEFDLTTFFLEIINFAVLVWVLTRLLYRPILAGIAQRRENVEKVVAEAEKRRAEAAELQKNYELRMAEWEKEKADLRRSFESTLATERGARLDALHTELDVERQRAEEASAAHLREMREAAEREVAEQSVRFCARLLKSFASPALESSIVDAALAEVAHFSAERLAALAQSFDGTGSVRVLTRFPLADPARDAVRRAVATLTGRDISPAFTEDAALIAGVRIELGGWSLEADLSGELRAFALAGTS